MSATADHAANGPVSRFGSLQPGMVVQELGWDEDIDEGLRSAIEGVIEGELVDDRYGDVVDAVILWWREDDGDLVDGLVDWSHRPRRRGAIWLMTPKVGRPNYVDASDISEAAPTGRAVHDDQRRRRPGLVGHQARVAEVRADRSPLNDTTADLGPASTSRCR